MRELIHGLLDWVYPPRCMSCRNPLPLQNKRGRGLWLCSYCENLFQPLDGPGCVICSGPLKQQGVDDDYGFVHDVTDDYQDFGRDRIDDRHRHEQKEIIEPYSLEQSVLDFLSKIDEEKTDDKKPTHSTAAKPPHPQTCASCRSRTFHFTHNRALFAYEDLVRDLIRDIKFRQRKHIAEGLGRLWGELAAKQIPAGTMLVPLPMHKKKRRKRGFDQAEILAKALSAATGAIYTPILERTQNTPPQSGLHPRQRAENVRGAFRIKPDHNANGQNYILIDDIYTTGASLNECARVLKAGGAAEVSAMTLAIAIKKEKPYSEGAAH